MDKEHFRSDKCLKDKIEFLSKYRTTLEDRNSLGQRINELGVNMTCPTEILLDEKHAGSRASFDLSDLFVKKESLQVRFDILGIQCYELEKEITKKIEELPSETEKAVIWLKYIRCTTWMEASKILGYSIQHIYEIRALALKHFHV